MYQTRKPSYSATVSDTVAIERADQPGYVRVYRRETAISPWQRPGIMLASNATILFPNHAISGLDSSD